MDEVKLVVFRPNSMQAMNDHLASLGYVEVFAGCWVFRDNRQAGDIASGLKKYVDSPGAALCVVEVQHGSYLALFGQGNYEGIASVVHG